MKYIFNKINEHIESAFESAIPQGFSSTHAITHVGLVHVDNEIEKINKWSRFESGLESPHVS